MMYFRMNQKFKRTYFTLFIVAILISMGWLYFTHSKDLTSNQKKESIRISKKKSLAIETSFMMNTSKKYVYKTTKSKIKRYDGKLHKWEYKNDGWYDGTHFHTFIEDNSGLRDIENNAALLISYPVTVGKKWYVEDDEMTLVRIYEKMTTPAGNFQNVIEVSQSNEEQTKIAFRLYYAENVGLIRVETGDRKLLSDLVKL